MIRKMTFTESYNYFLRGTFVTPTSRRCVLEVGKIYEVEKSTKPLYAGDEAVAFVKGHNHGVSTEYLREVTAKERVHGIEKKDWM